MIPEKTQRMSRLLATYYTGECASGKHRTMFMPERYFSVCLNCGRVGKSINLAFHLDLPTREEAVQAGKPVQFYPLFDPWFEDLIKEHATAGALSVRKGG